jgi:hypothetical protein
MPSKLVKNANWTVDKKIDCNNVIASPHTQLASQANNDHFSSKITSKVHIIMIIMFYAHH